jgi:hypothetical protein
MNRVCRLIFVLPLLLSPLAGCYVAARPAPHPAPVYEATPGPRPGWVWIAGHWQWNGRRQVWIRGHWRAV